MWVKLHASHLFGFTLQFFIYSIKSLKILYSFIQNPKRHRCGICFDNNWRLNQVICLQKVSVRASVRSVRLSDKAVYELNIKIFSCEYQGPNSVWHSLDYKSWQKKKSLQRSSNFGGAWTNCHIWSTKVNW